MKDKFLAIILWDLPKEFFVNWTHFFWGGKFQVCVLEHVIDLDKKKLFFFLGGIILGNGWHKYINIFYPKSRAMF